MAIDATSGSNDGQPFGELLERLPVLVYVFDLREQRLDYVNSAIRAMLGYRVEHVVSGGAWLLVDSVHPDDQAVVAASHARYRNCGDTMVETECRLRHQNGHRWVWIRRRDVVIERAADGSPVRILGTAADITESKSARRRLLDHQERILQLIAYDLHDGVVQGVVGAQMAVEGLAASLGDAVDGYRDEFDLLRKLLRKAIDEGRRMIAELRPMIIDEMGVVQALQFLVEEEEAAQRLTVEFSHDVEFERLAPLLEGTVYRIAQEALNNVRRHAQADEAAIRLSQAAGSVRLEIEDHGVGFDFRDVEEGTYGLEGIRERARMFGGTATIDSKPGRGTLVTAVLPIELPPEWRDE